MKRTIILLLDSVAIGASKDADKFIGTLADGSQFNDVGSNTLGHIAQQCVEGKAENGRSGLLNIPNLNLLGYGRACAESSGHFPHGLDESVEPIAAYGYAKEISTGKDTPSGHWEITGAPVLYEWGYFHNKQNSFPAELLDNIVEQASLPGYLGNCHASGTTILAQLGDEHIKTGKPIFYTSMDSVFQIACHEDSFGLQKLYKLCTLTRELLEDYNIGRVIARPFIGTDSSSYVRTGNRHDYSILPPAPTLLDRMKDSGGQVISIGKISDIFAQQGITKAIWPIGLKELFDSSLEELKLAGDQAIIFTNFVNFDADFGHRRDVSGYASALEYFDTRLPEILELMKQDDLLVLTADHGCDPTWKGTDHTREHIPVIFYGKSIQPGSIGLRETFADIGQSIAAFHGLAKLDYGKNIF
ncbi:MAG: phosphopentomutase [gamma proteobacterium symbiont of Taylorina sp.]|nr:phosphopentomutase [gamma proteobacterium symbiont of Taylorina sp.]